MAESKYLELNNANEKTGGIAISPDVIEAIAGITVDQTDGAHLMGSNFSKSVNTILGRDGQGSGARLFETDAGLVINVSVMLDFGVSVPQIATKIQERVQEQILFMTEIVINEVNVLVNGMLPDKSHSDINPDDIFSENNGD